MVSDDGELVDGSEVLTKTSSPGIAQALRTAQDF
jgi:hypothetical protein